jgi:hypothetical protein
LRLALGGQQPLVQDLAFAVHINRFTRGLRQYKAFAMVLELGEQG